MTMATNTKRKKNSPHVLNLDGELTIYRAAEIKQTLLAALDASAVVEVDLSKVSELDSAGVQLLMLAKQTATAANRELRLTAHSPAVLDVMDLLNLGSYFGDPLIMSPGAA
jgi:anti-sigma B factor antagonist